MTGCSSYLLGAPFSAGVSHVLWRLNRRHKLKSGIANANNTNCGTSNYAEDGLESECQRSNALRRTRKAYLMKRYTASENVDCHVISIFLFICNRPSNSQTPRPRKLKRKGAHRDMYEGIWNSSRRVAMCSQCQFAIVNIRSRRFEHTSTKNDQINSKYDFLTTAM